MSKRERKKKHTALIAERMNELLLCDTAITILVHIVEEFLVDKREE